MRHIPNRQLTPNFKLYEFLEAQLPAEAVAMNWKYITNDTVFRAEMMALELEKIRKLINANFKSDVGFDEIGMTITSGFRCKEWELYRERSGESQHTIMAVDFQAVDCTKIQSSNILKWVFEKFDPWWNGGLSLKFPSKQVNILLIGFLHIDARGKRARWIYS